MKRVVTMQDISCLGKCSLTAALPVISAMGVETAVIPTAVLSTHTMFHGVAIHDLTEEIRPILAHWKKEGFSFDAVYTGYLGSKEQIGCAMDLLEQFGKDGLKIVDPCMADYGKLYAGFSNDFPKEMRRLCAMADIICPNMTEACLLLDLPYQETYEEQDVRTVLSKLAETGAAKAVITGISFDPEKIGAYAYDACEDQFFCYFCDKEPVQFHGTGDLWASVLCGAMVRGMSFEQSVILACDSVRECIHLTLQEEGHNTYGVNFEQALPFLIRRLGETSCI